MLLLTLEVPSYFMKSAGAVGHYGIPSKDCIIYKFQMGMGVQRNISLGEMEPVFVMASTQGVIVKKFFIVSYSIKNCIPRRDLGQLRGMQKKTCGMVMRSLAPWGDSPLSGGFNFYK